MRFYYGMGVVVMRMSAGCESVQKAAVTLRMGVGWAAWGDARVAVILIVNTDRLLCYWIAAPFYTSKLPYLSIFTGFSTPFWRFPNILDV